MTNSFTRSTITRRRLLAFAGAAAFVGIGSRTASADAAAVEGAVTKITGGAAAKEGRISIELPEIAENGNTVPLKIEVDSPMTDSDYVKVVHVFAEGNPQPDVASFHFTPMSGKASASTRMRLAKTQNVVALAQMSDGTWYTAAKQVKVTIGGCGG